MICTCLSCHLPFWRYRRNWPPPGFCSLPCLEVGPKKLPTPPPELPEEILREMKRHRWEVHDTASMLAFFDCPRCDELEQQYGEAISYHVSRITGEIVSESEKLRLNARSTNA